MTNRHPSVRHSCVTLPHLYRNIVLNLHSPPPCNFFICCKIYKDSFYLKLDESEQFAVNPILFSTVLFFINCYVDKKSFLPICCKIQRRSFSLFSFQILYHLLIEFCFSLRPIYISYHLRRTQRSVLVLYLADSVLDFPGSQVDYSAFF